MRNFRFLLLFGFLSGEACLAHQGTHGSMEQGGSGPSELAEQVHRELDGIASSVGAMLPMAVNEDTQATGVEVSWKELIYRYRFSVSGAAYDKSAFDRLRRTSVESMCTTPDARALLEKGAKFTYVFFDRNEVFVTAYTICRLTCLGED